MSLTPSALNCLFPLFFSPVLYLFDFTESVFAEAIIDVLYHDWVLLRMGFRIWCGLPFVNLSRAGCFYPSFITIFGLSAWRNPSKRSGFSPKAEHVRCIIIFVYSVITE